MQSAINHEIYRASLSPKQFILTLNRNFGHPISYFIWKMYYSQFSRRYSAHSKICKQRMKHYSKHKIVHSQSFEKAANLCA